MTDKELPNKFVFDEVIGEISDKTAKDDNLKELGRVQVAELTIRIHASHPLVTTNLSHEIKTLAMSIPQDLAFVTVRERFGVGTMYDNPDK